MESLRQLQPDVDILIDGCLIFFHWVHMRSSFDALKIDDRLEVSKSLILLVCSFATFEAEVFGLKIGLIDSTLSHLMHAMRTLKKTLFFNLSPSARVCTHTHTYTQKVVNEKKTLQYQEKCKHNYYM